MANKRMAIAFLVPYGMDLRPAMDDMGLPDTSREEGSPADDGSSSFSRFLLAPLRPRPFRLGVGLLPRVGLTERISPIAMAAIARPAVMVLLVAQIPSTSLGRLKACLMAKRILSADVSRATPPRPKRGPHVAHISPRRRILGGPIIARRPRVERLGLEIPCKNATPSVRVQAVIPLQRLAREPSATADGEPIRVLRRDDTYTFEAQAARAPAG